MKDLKYLHFFKALKHLIPVVFLLVSFSITAHPILNIFSVSISEIINKEYKLKTYQELNEFMEENSIEDLITSTHKSNPRVKKLAFFLYYIVKSESTFLIPLENNKSILVSLDAFSQIETLIKKTRTPEAWFIRGLLELREENYLEGLAYLNEAKKADHALAYLAHLKFSILNPDSKYYVSRTEFIYQVLREMEQRNITVPGFNFLMGSILYAKGRFSEAKEWFTKALKDPIFPNAVKAYMGLIYKKNRQYPLAKKYLAEASEEGVYVVKPRLLEIYLQEGDYKVASELLEDMALHWGRYNDSASIKASFLLSYIMGRGLGVSADPIQSYIWADRARKIYHLSQDVNTPRTVDLQTGRYMIPNTFTLNNTAQTSNNSEHSSPKIDDPSFIFKLMSFRESTSQITERQWGYMAAHLHGLVQTLTRQGKMETAYSASNIMFRDLHFLPSNRCPGGFAN